LPALPRYVGLVVACSLEEAYAKSQNNTPDGWYRGNRSTAVGDVIEDNLGRLWAVANIGFVQIAHLNLVGNWYPFTTYPVV